ncbi:MULTISPECIES: hypothetical protein [unclassified Saccharopolyspora]|uniref:hypothetical protein n=1 Tax=unclassified Saccharopolyspora TaxID=2646250 RepID=UPI001CD7D07D|nr:MULTISPECIES: hypothetical protein [unclassified Saccharopolyspora]MCA1186898.1 hypothetical protein [Saccharopolyspora sp. 6T]MCA1193339.1 hypothetical protein [Saccharopolyspora sp. 6V]MCA1228048.1 hypothetical protein [Saccharopolyspora sp. 6M]MCA1281382.1 hypothetical protein [Saccharopolyspora sp. 7B]
MTEHARPHSPARKPDPITGLPRPPRAPVLVTWRSEGRTRRAFARFPPAPPGEGPILEWCHGLDTGLLKAGLFVSGLGVLRYCWLDWGFEWARTWWLWAIAAAAAVPFYLRGRSEGYSAGADWFASSTRSYVKLYKLKTIAIERPGDAAEPWLVLTDGYGGSARAPLHRIQRKRALWDLVYNGIAHSVHRGPATATGRALDLLELR